MRSWVRTALLLGLVVGGGFVGRGASAGPDDPSVSLTGPATVARERGAAVEVEAAISPAAGAAALGVEVSVPVTAGWAAIERSVRRGGDWGPYVPARTATLGVADDGPPWRVRFRGTLTADAPATLAISVTASAPARGSATATHTVAIEEVASPRLLEVSFGPAAPITDEGRTTVPFAFTVAGDRAVRPADVVVTVSGDGGLAATRTLAWPSGIGDVDARAPRSVTGTVVVTGVQAPTVTRTLLRLSIAATDVGGSAAAPAELRLSLAKGSAPRAGISVAGPLSGTVASVRVVALASGGAAPVRFTWSDDEPGATREAEAPGELGVLITGADHASSEASVVIAASGVRPDVRIAPVAPLTCLAPDATLVAQVSGGATPYARSWFRVEPSGESTALGGTGDRLVVSAGARYRARVVDARGGVAQATLRVRETKSPPVVVVAPVEPPPCASPDVRIRPTVTGGVPPYELLWRNAADPDGAHALGTSEELVLSGTPPAAVTFRVRDAVGCETMVLIPIPPTAGPPTVVLEGAGPLTCACDLRRLSARAAGGQGPYTYLWSTGATGPAILVDRPGIYRVTVTGANGCAQTAAATVELERDAPTVVVAVAGDLDPPLTPTVVVSATVGGGVAPYDLAWTDAHGTVVSREATFSTSVAGTYVLRATGANGCLAEAEAYVRAAVVAIEPGGFVYDSAQNDRYLVVVTGPKPPRRPEEDYRDVTAYAQPEGTRLFTRRFAGVGIFTQGWKRPHGGAEGEGRSLQLFEDRLALVGQLEPGAEHVGLHVLDLAQDGRSIAFHRKGAGITPPASGPHAFGAYGAVVDLRTGRLLGDGVSDPQRRLVGVVGGRGLYVVTLPAESGPRLVLALLEPTTGAEVWRAGAVATEHLAAVRPFDPLVVQDDFPVLFDDDISSERGLLFVGRDGAARLLDRAALGVSAGPVFLTLSRTREGPSGRILVAGLRSGGPRSGPTHETFVALDDSGTVLGRLDVPTARTEVHARDLSADGDLLLAHTDPDAQPAARRQSLARYRVPTAVGGSFQQVWVRHPRVDFGAGDVQEVVRCGEELLLRALPDGLLGLRASDGAVARWLGADDLGTGRPRGYRVSVTSMEPRIRRDAHHLFVHEWTPDRTLPDRIVRIPWSARGDLPATLTVPEPVFTDRDVPLVWSPPEAEPGASAGTVSGATWRTPSTPGPAVLTLRCGELARFFPVTVLDRRTVEDSDGDGLTDAEELRLRADPADPRTGPDPSLPDTDGDSVDDLFDLSPAVRPAALRWETLQRPGMLRSELPIRALGVDGTAEVWSTGFLGSARTLRGRFTEEGTKASTLDRERTLARLGVSSGDTTGDFTCFEVSDAERRRFQAPDDPGVTHEVVFEDHVIGRTKSYEFRYRQVERWFVARFMNRVPLEVPARAAGGPPPFSYLVQALQLRPGRAFRLAIQVRGLPPERCEGLGLAWALYASDHFERPSTVPTVEGYAPFVVQDAGLGTFEIRLLPHEASRPDAWLKLTAVRRTRGAAGRTEVVSVLPPTEVTGIVRQVVLEDDPTGRRTRSVVEELRELGGLAEPIPDEAAFVEGPVAEGGATRLSDVPVRRIERAPDGAGGWNVRVVSGMTTAVVKGAGSARALGASATLVTTSLKEWRQAKTLEAAVASLPKDHWARSPALGRTLVGFQAAQGVATVVVGVGRTVSAVQEGDEVKATVTATLTGLSAFSTATAAAKTVVAYGLVEKGGRVARFSRLAGERTGATLAIATGAVSVGYDVYRYEGETDPIRRLEARERISADLFTTGLGVIAAYWPPLAAAQATWTIGVELYRIAFGEDFAYRVSKDLGGALVFAVKVLATDALPAALCDEAWRTVKARMYAAVEEQNARYADLRLTVFLDPDQP